MYIYGYIFIEVPHLHVCVDNEFRTFVLISPTSLPQHNKLRVQIIKWLHIHIRQTFDNQQTLTSLQIAYCRLQKRNLVIFLFVLDVEVEVAVVVISLFLA